MQRRDSELVLTLERVAAVLLILIALFLHFLRLRHAGPLWRDEIGVVNLARMPWRDVLSQFPHEAFPPFFFAVIRGYTSLIGTGAFALRVFGWLVGMFCLAVFCYTGRTVGRHIPLLALALFAFNPLFFIWGDTIRGYGLGAGLIALTFGLVGRLLTEPKGYLPLVALGLATVGSVQLVMANSVLVAAIFVSAGAVLLAQRRFKEWAILFGIGGIAALSLIPYVNAYKRARDWDIVLRGDIGWKWMIEQFSSALSNPTQTMLMFWLVLGGLSLIGLAFVWVKRSRISRPDATLLSFSFLSILLAPVLYLKFLTILKYPTQEWYYLGVIAILMVGFDWISGALSRCFSIVRIAILILVGCVISASAFRAYATARVRMSNIDLAAEYIRSHAGPEDYVIVAPWYLGISFAYEYRGYAPWTTLPPIADLTVHRYDLSKEQMASFDPLALVLTRVAKCLESGHSVWIVSSNSFDPDMHRPLQLAPAPYDSVGWNEYSYRFAWWTELAYFVRTHSNHLEVERKQDSLTNPFENAVVIRASGSAFSATP